MVYESLFNMELRRDIQIESILEYTKRNARIITTAISHAYSSYIYIYIRCYSLQGPGVRGMSLLELYE